MSKKKFFTKKNFISNEECLQIINFYKQNIENTYKHGDTFPLDVNFSNIIIEKIEKICYEMDFNCKLDLCNVVMWPEGSKMKPHLDPDDVFACVIYLNDNYRGGETCVRKNFFLTKKIRPEVGKLVVFSNSKMLHWVNEVRKGNRYVLSLWFVRK